MKTEDAIILYIKHLKTLGQSDHTIRMTEHYLYAFEGFLENEGVNDIEDITEEGMEEYQQDLAFHITPKGTLLELSSQAFILGKIKGFTRHLKEKDYLLTDPSEKIKLPKTPKRLPKANLNIDEIQMLIKSPDTRTNLGYRDRVILELLYDTAIRRAEIGDIILTDLDLNNGYIHIKGKGSKERVVPVSIRVSGLVKNYILSIRPSFLPKKGKDPGYLFLSSRARKMNDRTILDIVKRHAKQAGIEKRVTTHTMRHCCATHMLKNGAPIRHLQEMLGHESLESTQIYTHVTINDLKEAHRKYHPGSDL